MGALARAMPPDGSAPPSALFLRLQARVAHTSVFGPILMAGAVVFMVLAAGI